MASGSCASGCSAGLLGREFGVIVAPCTMASMPWPSSARDQPDGSVMSACTTVSRSWTGSKYRSPMASSPDAVEDDGARLRIAVEPGAGNHAHHEAGAAGHEQGHGVSPGAVGLAWSVSVSHSRHPPACRCPVTKEASDESRKAAAAAISSGWPIRPSRWAGPSPLFGRLQVGPPLQQARGGDRAWRQAVDAHRVGRVIDGHSLGEMHEPRLGRAIGDGLARRHTARIATRSARRNRRRRQPSAARQTCSSGRRRSG